MALSQLTRKQLMELVEAQLETIRELTCKNQPRRLLLELDPADDRPVDEFMMAGAIYRYLADPNTNLDMGLVVEMIEAKINSGRIDDLAEAIHHHL